MKRWLYFLLLILLVSCQEETDSGNPHVIIETKYGKIELELYADKAPITTAAFLSYVDSGFYENTSFYRVLNVNNQPSNAPKTEILQGG